MGVAVVVGERLGLEFNARPEWRGAERVRTLIETESRVQCMRQVRRRFHAPSEIEPASQICRVHSEGEGPKVLSDTWKPVTQSS